jgi:HD-like signal output (HDOD) protein
MDAALQTRILACPTLPSIPAVALEVVRACQEDEVDLRRLVATLEKDPALTAKILRVANSARLAARSEVTTLSRALTLLGTNSVLTLALSFTLVSSRCRGIRGGFDHDRHWRRALMAAASARALAVGRDVDREELFLCGLLQDLGMLVLAEALADEYGMIVEASEGDHARLVELERDALGTDHAEVSSFVAAQWDLPALVVETGRGSHDPGRARGGRPEVADAVGCVHLAGLMADVFAGAEPHQAKSAAERHLGLSPDALHAALTAAGEALPELTSVFEVVLTHPAEIEDVLRRAQEALARLTARAEHDAAAAAQPAEDAGDIVPEARLAEAVGAALRELAERREPLTVTWCEVSPSSPDGAAPAPPFEEATP